MKRIESQMQTNTWGIADQIAKSGVIEKVYSMSHGSGVTMVIRDADGQLYTIDITPARFSKHQDAIKDFLMRSENPKDKEILQQLKAQEAKSQKPIENWPTQASGRKIIIEAKKTPAWQREEGKSDSGGLNEKGRKSYEKENPGSDLKPPVTEENPKGKDKKRQDSYCARSKGQMNDHNIDCSKDPDKPICKSRKRWNC